MQTNTGSVKNMADLGKLVPRAGSQSTKAEKQTIELPRGKEFLLKLECRLSDIIKGVQIRAGTPGAKQEVQHPKEPSSDVRYSAAVVDLESLLSRVSVKSMNVTNVSGYHTLYIKCEEVGNAKGKLGFDTWEGPYSSMARKILREVVWNRAIFRIDDNRSSLSLRKQLPSERQAETKIFFAIAPSAAE